MGSYKSETVEFAIDAPVLHAVGHRGRTLHKWPKVTAVNTFVVSCLSHAWTSMKIRKNETKLIVTFTYLPTHPLTYLPSYLATYLPTYLTVELSTARELTSCLAT
jgi:hypothetical protein